MTGFQAHDYHSDPLSWNHSRRQVLQSCPRRHLIEYGLGLEPIAARKSSGLNMGAAHAEILRDFDLKAGWRKIYEPLVQDATSQWEVDDLICESRTVEVYAEAYIHHYCDNTFAREVEWSFDIPGSDKKDRGAADAIIVQGEDILVVEDKLLAQWSESNILALPLDQQVTGVIRAMRKLGHDVKGCLYRVTKKASIKRRMVKQPETIDEFIERLKDRVSSAPEEFLFQTLCLRTDEQIQEFEDEIYHAAEYLSWLEQQEKLGKPSFPRQPSTCGYMGSGCRHKALCEGRPGAQFDYRKKDLVTA